MIGCLLMFGASCSRRVASVSRCAGRYPMSRPLSKCESPWQIRSRVARTVEQAEGQERSGWGTLKGRIRVVGDVPPNRPLNINKDQSVCQPGGAIVRADTMEVDSATGGIANVLVYALDLSGDDVHEDAKGGKTDQNFLRPKSLSLPFSRASSPLNTDTGSKK